MTIQIVKPNKQSLYFSTKTQRHLVQLYVYAYIYAHKGINASLVMMNLVWVELRSNGREMNIQERWIKGGGFHMYVLLNLL